jgi:hypothetical protein
MFGLRKIRKPVVLAETVPVVPAPQVSVAERDGRAVLMDLRSSSYYGLDETGTRVWQLVLKHKTPSEIFASIELEYDAPAGQLREDARRFLTSLLMLGLVRQ